MFNKVDKRLAFVQIIGHNDAVKEKAILIQPAKSALVKLGADLKRARQRRRLSMALLAERASISRTTLMSIERGNPAVSMGHYAMVIALLGFAPSLRDVADRRNDPTAEYADEP